MNHLCFRSIRCNSALLRVAARQLWPGVAMTACADRTRCAATSTARACLATSTAAAERHAQLDTLKLYEQPALYDAVFPQRQFNDEVIDSPSIAATLHRASLISTISMSCHDIRDAIDCAGGISAGCCISACWAAAAVLPRAWVTRWATSCILVWQTASSSLCVVSASHVVKRVRDGVAAHNGEGWQMLQVRPCAAFATTGS